MCGICGIVADLPADRIRSSLNRMNDSVAHRGPDDAAVWAEDGFGFGMRRLSIIDLEGGRQPMWIRDTGIVYNGEIYNYRQLRRELERRGKRFQTFCDTEVALASFVDRGLAAVDQWNGMFGVAFWNRGDRKLTLIRDRMGIKPLYYYWDGDRLVFASELKAILASGLIDREINQQAIWDVLTFGYVPEPQTMWKSIFKLPAGHTLTSENGKPPQVSCYSKIEVISEQGGFSYEEKVKEFEALFLNAVELRISAADVPVGIFLSGGLDSSAVAAASMELGHRKLNTFCVGFDDPGYSELEYSRVVASHIGSRHHEITLTRDDFWRMLPEAVWFLDEPILDLAMVPLLAISRLARNDVKVVLSGEGGDELLAGYGFDRAMLSWEVARRLQSFPHFLSWPLCSALSLLPKLAPFFRRVRDTPLSEWNRNLRSNMSHYWSEDEKNRLWSADTPVFECSSRVLDQIYQTLQSREPLDQVLSVYQKSYLLEDLLMKADKMSMAASLELRVPFLDFNLVKWANRQPVLVKVGPFRGNRFVTKNILRRFCVKRLPDTIIQRPKLGFPVPEKRWLRDEGFLSKICNFLFAKESCLKRFFQEQELKRNIGQLARSDAGAYKIWMLVVLEFWLRKYGDFCCEPSSRASNEPAISLAIQ